jgi:trans-aconitate 2-methyltransferase
MSQPTTQTTTSLPIPIRPGDLRAVGDHYTFGDNPTAADRLALLAATYEPSSARLLRPCASLAPRLVVDLGCGPGHSTRLLHALLSPVATVGLDRSGDYVARAQETAPPGVAYAVHDVARPLPGERPDLLYCRFLLTHLSNRREILAGWATSAAPRATLIVEETADMSSSDPVFQLYYRLVGALQAHYGQALHVGTVLDDAVSGSGWEIEISAARDINLPAPRMARLHHMNLATWRHDPFARTAFAPEMLDELGAGLKAIADKRTDAPDVRHVMRQLVLMKR